MHVPLSYTYAIIETCCCLQACQSATLLELHQHFTVEDLMIPLVFQDKLSVAEEFLLGSPEHQRLLVTFLDGLLGKRNIRHEAEIVIR
jgi:hypothetical protein